MFFEKINFEDPDIKQKFSLKSVKHDYTYDYYYEQYNAALRVIFEKGLKKNYTLNSKARGILCLLRHSFELCLKVNLSSNKIEVPPTHDFQTLLDQFTNSPIPVGLAECFAQIDKDKDGASFRYLADSQSGNSYFHLGDRIELSPVLEAYNGIKKNGFVLGEIAQPFEYKSRIHSWDLTFHMGESFTLGNIRAEYDGLASFLIDAVINDNVKIESIYLPLLYILRHSLELALKSNISDVKNISEKLREKDIKFEHSLARLYNMYRGYLNELDTSKLPKDLKDQLQQFIDQYQALNDSMHDLDNNSRYFKYPVDKNGATPANPYDFSKINMVEILRLRYFTNPFLLFTNVVLYEAGLHDLK